MSLLNNKIIVLTILCLCSLKYVLSDSNANFRNSLLSREDINEILDALNIKSRDRNKIRNIIGKAENAIRNMPEDQNGNLDPSFIVNEFIADPFPIKDFNVSESSAFKSWRGEFSNMSLYGLKSLQIKSTKVNLGLMKMTIIMELPFIRLQGIYNITAKMRFMPEIYGNGSFNMNITDTKVYVSGDLIKSANSTARVGEIVLDVNASSINLYFDNFMGNKRWSFILNTILNKLSSLIFENAKQSMLSEVSHDLTKAINARLATFPLDLSSDKSANIFDDLLEQTKKTIRKEIDPLILPSFKDRLNYNMLFVVLEGEVEFFNGRIYGLSTLVRTGDIIAAYDNNEVIFEASMGFTNLTGEYQWKTNFMGKGPSGSASLSLSSISCRLKVRQRLRKGAKPSIDDFRVEQIKHLWIDMNGLGTWDFILEILMNLLTNAFKKSLAKALSGPVRDVVQMELNNMNVTFI